MHLVKNFILTILCPTFITRSSIATTPHDVICKLNKKLFITLIEQIKKISFNTVVLLLLSKVTAQLSTKPSAGYCMLDVVVIASYRQALVVLIRPPGTMSSGRAYVLPVMFYFFRHSFSETLRPIALKLCHMIRIWP